MMNIDDVKRRRAELEQQLQVLLHAFEAATGCEVLSGQMEHKRITIDSRAHEISGVKLTLLVPQ